jgi:hypothetical protein
MPPSESESSSDDDGQAKPSLANIVGVCFAGYAHCNMLHCLWATQDVVLNSAPVQRAGKPAVK